MTVGTVLFQSIAAFFACSAFCIIFNAPRRELPYCGFCGVISWMVYFFINDFFQQPVTGTFFAAIIVTACARYLSYFRQAPSTMYHIAGIIPLVPGMKMYNTMWGVLNGDVMYSYEEAVMALKLAGVVGIGSILVLALPYSVFEVARFHKK